MNRIILASSSPYRKELLSRLNITFDSISPDVDEDYFKEQGLQPEQLAATLAKIKALKIQKENPDACVIGGDQVLAFDGQVYGKAGSPDAAIEQLSMLSGHMHELITSIHVTYKDKNIAYTDRTRLYMRKLGPDQIRRYIELDNPIDCAGSYKLEQRGISLFDKVESNDQTAIVGIPLIELSKILRDLGFSFP